MYHLLKTTFDAVLFFCCFIASIHSLQGQVTLGRNQTLEINTLSSGEITIPDTDQLTIEIRGGDGGDVRRYAPGIFGCDTRVSGGAGATAQVTLKIGNTGDALRPGGILRAYLGQKGGQRNAECLNLGPISGGGGGASAMIYLPPGKDPLGANWKILAVAGGGGGAARPLPGINRSGQGGRSTEMGGSSGQNSGGSFADCPEQSTSVLGYSGAGGGLRCSGEVNDEDGGTIAKRTVRGNATDPTTFRIEIGAPTATGTAGTSSNSAIAFGGLGFAGGGAAGDGGGGGGGFFGGAADNTWPGGGGGSFATTAYGATNGSTTAGADGGGTAKRGFVKITTRSQCPDGDVLLQTQQDVLDFAANYPNCTDLPGNLTISGNQITDLSPLGNLQTIGGIFNINQASLLTKLDGLSNLTTIGGNLFILLNDRLTDISALSKLTTISGILRIRFNLELPNLNGLANLRTVGSDVDIVANDKLTDVTGICPLYNQGTIGGNTIFDGNATTDNPAIICPCLQDTQAPSATCQNLTIQLDPTNGAATITPQQVDNGSTDACGAVTLSLSDTSFGCNDVGVKNVSLTVTDESGNASSCTATVKVEDNVAPVANCNGLTINEDAQNLFTGPIVSLQQLTWQSFTAQNSGLLSEIRVRLQGPDDPGTTASTLAIKVYQGEGTAGALLYESSIPLSFGNQARWVTLFSEEAVAVEAGEKYSLSLFLSNGPQYNWQIGFNNPYPDGRSSTGFAIDTGFRTFVKTTTAIPVALDANGTVSITANQIDNGSSDACGIVNLSLDKTSFTCSDTGIQTVSLTATDKNGNSSSCTTSVRIIDNMAPLAVCQNITVELNDNGVATLTAGELASTSTDPCGPLSFAFGDGSTQFALDCEEAGSNILKTVTVTDVSGNQSTCSVTLTVEDNVAPVARCVGITVNEDAQNVLAEPRIPLDQVAWQSFTAQNSGLLSEIRARLRGPNNSEATASTLAIKVYQGEGTTGQLLHDSSIPLSFGFESRWVTLFSEEAIAVEAGEKYTLALFSPPYYWHFSYDNFYPQGGAQGSPDLDMGFQAFVTTMELIPLALDANGTVTITANQIDNGSSDACGVANLSLDKTSFTCSDIGIQTVSLTATDKNGNSSSCTTNVKVFDNIAPVAHCKDATVELNGDGIAFYSIDIIDDGSSDNCSLSLSSPVFSATCSDAGVFPATLVAKDPSGNESTCTANITIVDRIAPVALCQDVSIQLDANGIATTSALAIDNGSSDACGITNLSLNQQTFGCAEVGVQTVTLTVTDINGNASSCTAQVTITDEIAPDVVCADMSITFNGETAIDIPSTSIFDATSSFDICGPVSFVSQNITEIGCEAVGGFVEIEVIGADPNGNTSSCTALVEVLGMPCDFTETGIGCEAGADATYDPAAESFTLTAEDCTGYPDGEVSFLGTTLCGDGEIIVHVDAINSNARAGVIMMENSDPGARLVSIVKDLTRRVRTEYRPSTNGGISVKRKNRTGVDWLRIVRVGNKFKTYTSTNGSYWRLAHSINFSNFAECIEVGLITYAKDADEQAVAVFSQLEISGENSSYVQANLPPVAMESHSANHQLGASTALQVSPNPFQDETRINFTLDQTQQISLAIYNLQGQLVQRFEDSLLDAGEHVITWEGTNQAGVKMPSGVYIIQLRVDEHLVNKRVILQQ